MLNTSISTGCRLGMAIAPTVSSAKVCTASLIGGRAAAAGEPTGRASVPYHLPLPHIRQQLLFMHSLSLILCPHLHGAVHAQSMLHGLHNPYMFCAARCRADYAPFNIDVTTNSQLGADPTTYMRVCIGGDGSWFGSYGGVAHVSFRPYSVISSHAPLLCDWYRLRWCQHPAAYSTSLPDEQQSW